MIQTPPSLPSLHQKAPFLHSWQEDSSALAFKLKSKILQITKKNSVTHFLKAPVPVGDFAFQKDVLGLANHL